MLTDTSLYWQARQRLRRVILESLIPDDLCVVISLVAHNHEYLDEDHWLAQYWHTGE